MEGWGTPGWWGCALHYLRGAVKTEQKPRTFEGLELKLLRIVIIVIVVITKHWYVALRLSEVPLARCRHCAVVPVLS